MVSVDHVTLQYDRSKSSGILRSLCSLLFCYYSLLVFVKIARFGYRHYYKTFLYSMYLQACSQCSSGSQAIGSCELRHWWPNDSAKQNAGLFSLSLFGLCGGLLRHFSIAASNSQRLSFMSDGHEGLREIQSFDLDRHHKTKFCVPREHDASMYSFCNGFQTRCLSLLLDKIVTLLRPLPNFKSRTGWVIRVLWDKQHGTCIVRKRKPRFTKCLGLKFIGHISPRKSIHLLANFQVLK